MRKVKMSKHKNRVIEVGRKCYLSCPLDNTLKTDGECHIFCVGFEVRDCDSKKEIWCNVFDMVIGELQPENETDAAQE